MLGLGNFILDRRLNFCQYFGGRDNFNGWEDGGHKRRIVGIGGMVGGNVGIGGRMGAS